MWRWLIEQVMIFLVATPIVLLFGAYMGLPALVSLVTTGFMWTCMTLILCIEKPWDRG